MDNNTDSLACPFTARQRRGLVVFCLILLGMTFIALVMNRSFVSDPLPESGERFDALDVKLDPNTADMSLLSALPALGERRAQDIVDFREKTRAADPRRTVFEKPEDLMQVRGIGTAIVEQVRPFLRFRPPATSRAVPHH